MKKIIPFFALAILISCKEAPKVEKKESAPKPIMAAEKVDNYPASLKKVFDAHGSVANWKQYKTLSFQMPKPDGAETHTTDLYSRKEKILAGDVQMGADENGIWLWDKKDTYKGDAIFYHNLMFYFYAMPFVLADDGINYGETQNLEFEGKSYPGIKISYDAGVGTSPKDEYYLHYEPETHQMAWLGYTVTYRSGEKSDNVKWIRYNDWTKVGEVQLPKSISWYTYEGRTIKELRNTMQFNEVALSKMSKPNTFYTKPADAVYVNKETENK
ncbi:DUF6503 family protein [Maribacter sp. 2210JD10-5]|uniref:DUF6503 family protein n=1 Tax=Maribacter sp. 2210JD10-5 TaxID=3386272 RepID=UPI0039BC899A